AVCVGYTNASWTLRAELAAEYVCRLLNHMQRHGYQQIVARPPDSMPTQPLIGLTSGYIQRGASQFPSQGAAAPWVLPQNYLLDLFGLHFGNLDDGTLLFSKS